jgi:hypothetical protein
MATDIPMTDDDVEWLKQYGVEVAESFTIEFREAGGRFSQWPRILYRFTEAVDIVLKKGRSYFRSVDEAHNELCIASAILSNPDPKIARLEYEPLLDGCAKSIDFLATTADRAMNYYVDVKTIKPKPTDRWEQFEKAKKDGWFPGNVNVMLSKTWMGGELWHSMFAARARMLEYTLELEEKIAGGKLAAANAFFILALCGDGFDWHESHLEDFVSFYYSGTHRQDDSFSQAEQKYMRENIISVKRTIASFACMCRSRGAVRQKRLNWRVQPPSFL